MEFWGKILKERLESMLVRLVDLDVVESLVIGVVFEVA